MGVFHTCPHLQDLLLDWASSFPASRTLSSFLADRAAPVKSSFLADPGAAPVKSNEKITDCAQLLKSNSGSSSEAADDGDGPSAGSDPVDQNADSSNSTDKNPWTRKDPSKCVSSCDYVAEGMECKKCNADGSPETDSQKKVRMARQQADNAPGSGKNGAPGSCPGGGGGDEESILEDAASRRLSDVLPECDGMKLRSIENCRRPRPWKEAGTGYLPSWN